MSDFPIVTVVVANFNCAKFIESALTSALRQSLKDIEVIVVDDASTDDSVAHVARMALGDQRLTFLTSATNQGPSVARNRCIEAARGRWIAVMDSDDMMHPDRLAQLVEAAERDEADIVVDDLLIFDDTGNHPTSRCLRTTAPFWVNAPDYARSNVLYGKHPPLGYLKPLIRTDFLRTANIGYDPRLRFAEDYDFILRLLVSGARMRVYPDQTYSYRKHGGSISHRLSRQKLLPVIQASTAFLSELDDHPTNQPLRIALQERHASLQRAMAFDGLVVALQQRKWPTAGRFIIKNPRAAMMLYLPVISRLRALRKG